MFIGSYETGPVNADSIKRVPFPIYRIGTTPAGVVEDRIEIVRAGDGSINSVRVVSKGRVVRPRGQPGIDIAVADIVAVPNVPTPFAMSHRADPV